MPSVDSRSLSLVLQTLSPDSDYARGVLDVLALLGLVRVEQGRMAPADEVAAMLLNSLQAHVRDGVTVGLRWADLDAESPRGVDILRAVETARLQRVPQPSPARVVRAVEAVIKARQGGQDLYLMQYDVHAGRFQPIGGKQEPYERDLEDTLRREMAEELNLSAPPGPDDCILTLLRDDWQVTVLSATYGVLTGYTIAFYAVSRVRFPIRTDQDTCWLTREEIAAGRSHDGRPVSSAYADGLGLERLDQVEPGVEITA
jgi:8-oxo-dGTP pyrophosphatase MutT (NUDIX family)